MNTTIAQLAQAVLTSMMEVDGLGDKLAEETQDKALEALMGKLVEIGLMTKAQAEGAIVEDGCVEHDIVHVCCGFDVDQEIWAGISPVDGSVTWY